MTSLKAQQLLWTLAKQYVKQKTTFSRSEIVTKINELKYLAGQRNVPRLSLQREIQHLEHKLQGVYEIEKKMLAQKAHESARVRMMKKEIAKLRSKLAMTQDKDLQKKVEKLSSLLASQVAKKEVIREINLQEKFNEFKRSRVIPEESREEKIKNLQAKLEPLKLILGRVKADPTKVMMLNQQINFLENKLSELLKEGLIPPEVAKDEVKHTILFDVKGLGLPQEIDARLERELPLPPPPKMRR